MLRLPRSRKVRLGLAAVAGALVGFLALNFGGPEKQVEWQVEHSQGIDSPQFHREMSVLLGPPMVDGNTVEALQNGDEIFPAMLAAIRSARHSVTFETYIYWSGRIGREFSEALAGRARAGVPVKVMVDWFGSQKMDAELLQTMEDAGVEIERFHPLAWYTLSRMNNRTHRKLLVVDGHIGFTGGVGIADLWLGDAQDPQHWRDVHFRIEGPVVTQMQASFADNWIKTTGRVLQGEEFFPSVRPVGNITAQVFSSSPEGGADSMRLMYLLAIAAADSSIDLAASYFVPDDLTTESLISAMQRGVRLRIVLPGPHTDAEIVASASSAEWGRLLEEGAEIYEYQPTMYHAKVMVVDGYMVSVGSTNFDNRSFALNAEANLNVYDRAFAAHMTEVFEQDIAESTQMTLQQWRDRPWSERITEQFSNMLRSQL